MRRPLVTVVLVASVIAALAHAAPAQENQQAPPEITVRTPGKVPRIEGRLISTSVTINALLKAR